jgi:hypothetical protein
VGVWFYTVYFLRQILTTPILKINTVSSSEASVAISVIKMEALSILGTLIFLLFVYPED